MVIIVSIVIVTIIVQGSLLLECVEIFIAWSLGLSPRVPSLVKARCFIRGERWMGLGLMMDDLRSIHLSVC